MLPLPALSHPWQKGSGVAAAQAMEAHARLQRLAADDPRFLHSDIAARTVERLRELPPAHAQGGHADGDASMGEVLPHAVYDAWQARIETQCNVDGSVAALRTLEPLPSFAECVGHSDVHVRCAQRNELRWRDRDAPWLFVPPALHEVVTAPHAPHSVDWPSVPAAHRAWVSGMPKGKPSMAACNEAPVVNEAEWVACR